MANMQGTVNCLLTCGAGMADPGCATAGVPPTRTTGILHHTNPLVREQPAALDAYAQR